MENNYEVNNINNQTNLNTENKQNNKKAWK